MSRSRQNPNSTSVSLFPFLAVLLCTMGALVMLLVAMTHVSREQARLEPDAANLAAAEANEPIDETVVEESIESDAEAQQRRAQVDEAQKYLAKAEEQQAQLDETLREDQLKLSHAEDHIRRMTDRLVSMRSAIAELQEQDAQHYDDLAQAERNLKQLEALVAETKAEIEELEGERSKQFKSYSIVPYRGANGTRRKPIYVECREDRVILQPEGVELTSDDFRKPLGVGNPLAAALRASREYHVRNDPDAGFDPDAEPYPLIIVRPGGILAYYGVREAIRSWDSDFGYEMVDADWELNFPAANPVLFDLQARAVERARARRELLARAAPRAYGGSGFHSSSSDQADRGNSDKPYDGTTLGYAGTRQAEGGPAGRGGGGGGGMPGDPANFDSATGDGAGAEAAAENLAAGQYGQFQPGDASKGGAQQLGNEGGQGSSRSTATTMANSSGASGSPNGTSSQQSAPTGGASGGANGSAAPGSASNTVSVSKDVNLTAEANKRGADWAVEKNSQADIAIRRTVQVLVHNDRLVVLPGKVSRMAPGHNGVVGKTVYLHGATQQGLEAFVSQVREQVNSWGMAGQGLYWRPVLMLNVGPTGSGRARELSQLLERSGLDVEFERTATLPTAGGPQ